MRHLGDITKIDGRKIEPVDCITFGSPCFVAGTMILTEGGYKPIEEVKCGDRVLTHMGNWKCVEAIGNKISDTIILKGNHFGIECTRNHPFYSSKCLRIWNGNGYTRYASNPEWTAAEDMLGMMYAVPETFKETDIPGMEKESRKENDPPMINEDLFYFAGRYLGDGWIRNDMRSDRQDGQRNYTVYICDSKDKESDLNDMFSRISDSFSKEYDRNTVKFKTTNAPLVRWIEKWFSKGSLNKEVPSWMLGTKKEYREALLKGYMDSDGYVLNGTTTKFTTVSHKLAEGMRLVAESLGYSCAVNFDRREGKCIIEGREVNQHDTYQLA